MLARQTPETFEEAFDRISAERGGEVNQAVQQAAALALQGLTVQSLATDAYRIESGDTVLISMMSLP